MADPTWLPDAHLGVAATLAHVDECIAAVGNLLFAYQTVPGGIVRLRETRDGDKLHLVVDAIEPIPQKVPLLAADALNGLRAAIEHTIYIEAATHAGGELDEKAAKLVEMPASATYDVFEAWTRRQAKNGPAALRQGADLCRRIYDLQPLHLYADPRTHPLARLVAYTNHAKHRTPAVTAVGIPVVTREDRPPEPLHALPRRSEGPVQPGEVIFTASAGEVVPVTFHANVGINLPGTERWPTLIRELGEIAAWVRNQAIPRLITGLDSPKPAIPATYDITTGQKDLRAALAAATTMSAFERSSNRLQAAVVRDGMARTIAEMPSAPPFVTVHAWLESLTDSEVLERMRGLVVTFDHDSDGAVRNVEKLERMRDDAVAFAER